MNHNRVLGLLVGLALAGFLLLYLAYAQDPGGGRRGWGRRGRFDMGERLQQADANGNGMLEPEEIPDRMRFFLIPAAEQAGIDTSQPMPIDKLREAFEAQAARFGQFRRGQPDGQPDRQADGQTSDGQSRQPSGDASQPQGSPSPSKQQTQPLVPGFGDSTKLPPVPGFGVDAQPSAQATDNQPAANTPAQERDGDDRQRGRRRGWWLGPAGNQDENTSGANGDQGDGPRFAGPGFGGPGFGGPGFGGPGWRGPGSGSAGPGSPWGAGPGFRGPASAGAGPGGSAAQPNAEGADGGATNSGASGQDRVAGMAQAMIAQNDQNGNGILEGDEWRRGGLALRNSDHNGDGNVTKEELIQTLSSWGQSGGRQSGGNQPGGSQAGTDTAGSSAAGDGSRGGRGFGRREDRGSRQSGNTGSAGGGRSAAGGPATRRSYRALTPIERLPKEIPDWFVRADENGDGQVAMSEYSTSWTDEKAAEFAAIDLDSDGMITPKECLRAGRSQRSLASSQ